MMLYSVCIPVCLCASSRFTGIFWYPMRIKRFASSVVRVMVCPTAASSPSRIQSQCRAWKRNGKIIATASRASTENGKEGGRCSGKNPKREKRTVGRRGEVAAHGRYGVGTCGRRMPTPCCPTSAGLSCRTRCRSPPSPCVTLPSPRRSAGLVLLEQPTPLALSRSLSHSLTLSPALSLSSPLSLSLSLSLTLSLSLSLPLSLSLSLSLSRSLSLSPFVLLSLALAHSPSRRRRRRSAIGAITTPCWWLGRRPCAIPPSPSTPGWVACT